MHNKANGRGRFIYGDGNVHEGHWKNRKAQGYGEYFHHAGGIAGEDMKFNLESLYVTYKGHWSNDKQNGQGCETWADGSTYKGQYFKGKKHGMGTFTWADGSTYHGELVLNDIHGFGKYSFADGRQYTG